MKKFSLLNIILCVAIIGTVITGCGASKANVGQSNEPPKIEQADTNISEEQSDKSNSEEQVNKSDLEEAKPNFETNEYSANGIKFSYPTDWSVDDSNSSIIILKPSGDNPNNINMNFMITDLDTAVSSYSEYADMLKPGMEEQFNNGTASVEEYKDGTNNGAKFTMEQEVEGEKLKMMQVHIFKDKQVPIFTYAGKTDGFDSYLNQVNYIISSFNLEK